MLCYGVWFNLLGYSEFLPEDEGNKGESITIFWAVDVHSVLRNVEVPDENINNISCKETENQKIIPGFVLVTLTTFCLQNHKTNFFH